MWDDPSSDTGFWALQAGVLVRDLHPERFTEIHRALFAIRHDRGLHLDGPTVTATLAEVLGAAAAADIADRIEEGEVIATARKEHETVTAGPGAWGVPTFIASDDRAVFVRLMDRNAGETAAERAHGQATIERVLDLLDWTELNEFKATRIPR